jgi:cytochrome P450
VFDPVRGGVGQLSFGAGLHFCVGAPLARMELLLALPILFARVPELALADRPAYANLYHFHGLQSLNLSLR